MKATISISSSFYKKKLFSSSLYWFCDYQQASEKDGTKSTISNISIAILISSVEKKKFLSLNFIVIPLKTFYGTISIRSWEGKKFWITSLARYLNFLLDIEYFINISIISKQRSSLNVLLPYWRQMLIMGEVSKVFNATHTLRESCVGNKNCIGK